MWEDYLDIIFPTNLAIFEDYMKAQSLSTIIITAKLFCQWMIFYTNQKLWKFIVFLNRLHKKVLTIVFSLSISVMFTIIIIIIIIIIINARLQDPHFLLRIPMGTWNIFFPKIIDIFGKRSPKYSSALL
jgi:hypothetical protein